MLNFVGYFLHHLNYMMNLGIACYIDQEELIDFCTSVYFTRHGLGKLTCTDFQIDNILRGAHTHTILMELKYNRDTSGHQNQVVVLENTSALIVNNANINCTAV